MIHNIILQEAIDKTFNPAPIVSDFKRLMNTCALTKFKSESECAKLYSGFFVNQLETEEPLTFEQWCLIYTSLLNDVKFTNNMCNFIAMYQPKLYTGMFVPLMNLIDSELNMKKANRVRYLSDAKAFFNFLQVKMDSIGETIKAQVNDQNVIKFIVTINGVITTDIFYINNLIHKEMDNAHSPDDISYVVRTPITEDVTDLLETLQNYDKWSSNYKDTLNEGIVNTAKEKAKELYVKEQKASRAFDEFVMKKVKKIRQDRRNRKHAEMVGEALRINHEIKRLLGSLAVGAINPAIGVILWVTSVVIDRQTDKRDRDILVGQIKDELEIIEEKISQAERNGDDKAKIELIRLRQKLQKEYERINRIKFDNSRIAK